MDKLAHAEGSQAKNADKGVRNRSNSSQHRQEEQRSALRVERSRRQRVAQQLPERFLLYSNPRALRDHVSSSWLCEKVQSQQNHFPSPGRLQ